MTFFEAKNNYLLELKKEMNIYYRNLQLSINDNRDFTQKEDDILFYYNDGIEDIIGYANKLKSLSTLIGKVSLLDVLQGDINYFLNRNKKSHVDFVNKKLDKDWQKSVKCSCQDMRDLIEFIENDNKVKFQFLLSNIINNKKRAEYFTKIIFGSSVKHS